jgi:hypothetical protein
VNTQLPVDQAEKTALLNRKLDGARRSIPTGSRWLHKKGGRYMVYSHVIDSDNGEVRVLYGRIGGPGFTMEAEAGIMFVRPYEEWSVDRFIQLP